MSDVRVLILLGSVPLYGLELATIESGRMLQEAGVRVLFVTNAHWGDQAVNPRLDALGLEHRGLIFFGALERSATLRRLAIFLRLQVTESYRLLRVMREFRPTHVQIVDVWDFVNFLPAFLARRSVALVFCGHSALDLRHRLLARLFGALVRRASRVVVVSRSLAAHFEKLGVPAAKLDVIPNAVPRRPAATRVEREPPARRPGVLRLLYVGQIAAHKGVAVLVDVMLRLVGSGARVECLLLGDVESEWARAERARASSAGAGVSFAGYVADPTAWLASADVHVAPSLCNEAFGQVVIEAKAAGRPSIVFADGALPELVTDGRDGVVCPRGDAAALEAAVRGFLDAPDCAREQGERARASLKALGILDVAMRWARVYGLGA